MAQILLVDQKGKTYSAMLSFASLGNTTVAVILGPRAKEIKLTSVQKFYSIKAHMKALFSDKTVSGHCCHYHTCSESQGCRRCLQNNKSRAYLFYLFYFSLI